MPRRAAADIPPLTEVDRPDPPPDLSKGAAAIWRKTVASMKATWFTPETHDLLARYCGAMAESKRLEAELSRLDVNDPRYERLTSRYDKMASLALSYGRALRLTPKSNRTTSDGRDALRANHEMPWEFDPSSRRRELKVKPWEG
jgi:hypothetical protein